MSQTFLFLKSGCFSKMKTVLLSLIFLSIFLQASVAVKCPRSKTDIYTRETEAIGPIQCSGACAAYFCGTTDKVDDEGLPDNMIADGVGCPEDFFHECAKFVNEIDFIKNNNENDIDYFNGYVLYISGCGDEIDPTYCFQAKITHFVKKIKMKKDFKIGEVIWNPSDNLVRRNTASKNENDAIKFIGIFVLTWVIYTFI